MRPFPKDQQLGPWYRLAAVLLWPSMMTITQRDWHGVQHLGRPGDGMIVAPNHMSWFDPIVIAHFMNDNDRVPRFLAKDAVFEIPVLGRIVDGAGQIPVYRETDSAVAAVRAAVDAVNAGEAVVVYPEGTLTRDPELWPMTGKTGAARIALLSGKPVIPVAHWGAQEVMRPYVKEFNAFPPKTMHVIAGPPVDLDDLRDRELSAAVVDEATSRIMDAITELLARLRSEPAPRDRWDPRAGRREPVRHPLPPVGEGTRDMAGVKKVVKRAPAKKTSAKKASTKQAAARKTAGQTAQKGASVRKTVVKQAPAKKTVAKRAPAKKTVVKQAPVKKTVVKQAPVKKTVVKQAPVKKTVVKKSPAKQSVVKQAPVKKTTVKGATVKKAPVKQATVKRTAKR